MEKVRPPVQAPEEFPDLNKRNEVVEEPPSEFPEQQTPDSTKEDTK